MKLPVAHDGPHLLPRGDSSMLENGVRYGTAVVREVTRTLVERSGTTCQPGNNSPECAKPASDTNTQTLPIVLGAVIPITCAICVFVYLHRRNNKKVAREDANDPHKSMDFGMEFNPAKSKAPKRGMMGGKKDDIPEMTVTQHGDMKGGRAMRGLSMDMMNNPYLLPAGLAGSGESLHSMSRITTHDEHDPYRPVTFVRSSSDTSRSPRPFNENASLYSASTNWTRDDKSSLVANAQRMSQSFPKRGDSAQPVASPEESTRDLHSASRSVTPSRRASLAASSKGPEVTETRVSSRKDSLPPLPPMPNESPAEQTLPSRTTSQATNSSRPPRKASLAAAALPNIDVRASDASYYGEEAAPPPPPKVIEPEADDSDMDQIYSGRFSIDNSAPSQQLHVQQPNPKRVSVMGLRPLPPNLTEELPEQRADRIRSFYKEYFDDSRPNPQHGFYEDWDPAYLDAAVFDPETGDYVYPAAPFAQPMGRRAMTPPPRGAASLGGPGGDHARHYSTMSGGGARGPGGFRGRPPPMPKKKLPPPKTLTSLPTPHMLREDTALILNPVDFAPPTTFREHQNGRRPDSPMGIQRPYSPSVKAYSPLVPAFDELSVMPSPHHLRKSGTFASLDFAQLPRFRGQEGTASDTGSIRSARSGISAMQMDAVRAGAYRVSRIPKEYVTSREDLSAQLKPQMNLIRPA